MIGILIGIGSFFLLATNMIFWSTLLLVVSLVRFIFPLANWKKITTGILIHIGESCIYFNNLWINILHRPKITIEGFDFSDKTNWYIATSNHQSWADIFVLQYITNRKIPLLRFFMKDVLKWIPIVWVVGWSMNMPFLKRYSKEKLRRNPELRGKDIASMKKSFADLSIYPGTVFSFAEGTRFSEKKQKEENSNFYKLLAPKAGGIAITLATMPFIKNLIDFTIVYQSEKRTFWAFLCGEMSEIRIQAKLKKIPEEFFDNDYSNDEEYRKRIKVWLNDLWKEKEDFLKK